MKKYLKLLLIFPFILSIIILDYNYLNSLKLPSVIPPNYIITILLIISYFCKYISIFKIYSNFDVKETKEYNKYLTINIVFNIITMLNLVIVNSMFLVFSSITICLLSNLFLYYETKSYDIKSSKYLLFCIYFSLICSFLSLFIYFMNL